MCVGFVVSPSRRLFQIGSRTDIQCPFVTKTVLSFALPAVQIRSRRICACTRQLLLRCPTSCIHAVERKVPKRQICREQIWTPTAHEVRAHGQRESAGDPDGALILCSSGLNGVFRRASQPLRKTRCIPASPLRADPFKPSGARRGITGSTPLHRKSLNKIG